MPIREADLARHHVLAASPVAGARPGRHATRLVAASSRCYTPLLRKALASVALLVPWMIWKHRNACVFDHVAPSLVELDAAIKDESRNWAKAGAKGLRVTLPSSWDVH